MEPWYQSIRPSAADVRSDLFGKYKKQFPEDVHDELRGIILKHIPDTMTHFGSWRGYSVYGLDIAIKKQLEKEISELKAE